MVNNLIKRDLKNLYKYKPISRILVQTVINRMINEQFEF